MCTNLIRLFPSAAKTTSERLKKKPFYTELTELYSENAALYSSQHTSPCVARLRIATIIDDRGEDCYAWPVQDAIRDCDWEPFENVKVTHDYEY